MIDSTPEHMAAHGGRLSIRNKNGRREIYCMIDGKTVEVLEKTQRRLSKV